jgi:hypothetical protein
LNWALRLFILFSFSFFSSHDQIGSEGDYSRHLTSFVRTKVAYDPLYLMDCAFPCPSGVL